MGNCSSYCCSQKDGSSQSDQIDVDQLRNTVLNNTMQQKQFGNALYEERKSQFQKSGYY